jgi:outer membrane protein, multidrug efflux system
MASTATLASTRVSLAAEVALDYMTLRTYQQRLAIAHANAASQAETLQITDWKQQAGLMTSLDVEQARTNLEQSQASIPSLELGRAEAEHALALLTGQAPAALHATLGVTRALPTAPDRIAVAIPADTLRQRPDIRAAEYSLRAEVARTAEQQAARYPSLSLSGSLGWQAFSTAALGGSDTLLRAISASLAATLFDGGRRNARIALQDAVEEQALIAYETSILTALEDVENALVAYAAGRERLATRTRGAEAARNAAQLARTLYEAGSVDFQKVLDTDRSRLTAEDGLASAQGDLLAAIVKLYKALGGGWHANDETTDTRS